MKFEMFSTFHYIFMVSPFVLTAILHYSVKHLSYEKKRMIGIALSIIAVGVLIMRNIDLFHVKHPGYVTELVPLQICHFANIVLLYAFIKDDKSMFGLAFTLNLVAAYMSIIFADSLEGYASILSPRGMAYIIGHVMIVWITLWAFFNDFVVLNTKVYIKTLKLIAIMYILSLFINNIFGITYGFYSNYFYSLKPEPGTPLEIFFDLGTEWNINGFKINLVYVIGTGLFGAFVTYIVYLLSKLRTQK